MQREILTYPLSVDQVAAELEFFSEHFRALGYTHCEVLFGAAWGNDYYPKSAWTYISLQLADLVREVRRVEAAGLGRLGTDDLFIRIPNVTPKFHFCNDSDIHIRFKEPDEISEFFYIRWKLCGYHPAEWTTSAKGSRERIRID